MVQLDGVALAKKVFGNAHSSLPFSAIFINDLLGSSKLTALVSVNADQLMSVCHGCNEEDVAADVFGLKKKICMMEF